MKTAIHIATHLTLRFQAILTNPKMIKYTMHPVIIHHMEQEGLQIIMLTKMYREGQTMIRTIKSTHMM